MKARIFFKHLYLGPLGKPIHLFLVFIGRVFKPFMIYGYFDKNKSKFRKFTRVSSTAVLSDEKNISIGDGVWIWHHSIIDGSNGVIIGEGVQIGAWVGIFTHSSHIAIRLHGNNYIRVDRDERVGYVRGAVAIGDYTFIGAGAKILPGVTVGKGCVISSGAMVTKDVPDYSIVAGNPARVIGGSLDLDRKFLGENNIREQYFDRDAI